MVIDSSALVAILLKEQEASLFIELIGDDSLRLVSTLSFVETSIVVGNRFGRAQLAKLDALIEDVELALVPFNQEQAVVARDTYFRYGKGNHPAKLNFGDCCSYALAQVSGEALLFKGNDFSQTDIDKVTY